MSISDEDMIRLENAGARPRVIKLAGWVAHRVEDALAPVLRGEPKSSCLHILDEGAHRMKPGGPGWEFGKRRALVCAQHPERLLCNAEKCIAAHQLAAHADEVVKCLVCEGHMLDQLTGELHDFEGITGKVTLHRPVPFFHDSRTREEWFSYKGVLGVLPVAYLCPRHSEAAGDLPWRMGWPMGESGCS